MIICQMIRLIVGQTKLLRLQHNRSVCEHKRSSGHLEGYLSTYFDVRKAGRRKQGGKMGVYKHNKLRVGVCFNHGLNTSGDMTSHRHHINYTITSIHYIGQGKTNSQGQVRVGFHTCSLYVKVGVYIGFCAIQS